MFYIIETTPGHLPRMWYKRNGGMMFHSYDSVSAMITELAKVFPGNGYQIVKFEGFSK